MFIIDLIDELERQLARHGNVLVVTKEENGFSVSDVWSGLDDNDDVVVVVD